MEQLLWEARTECGTHTMMYEDEYSVFKEIDQEGCFCIYHHRYDGINIVNEIDNIKEVKVTPYFVEMFKNLLEYKEQKGILTNNEKMLFDEIQKAKETKERLLDELDSQYNRFIRHISLMYKLEDVFKETIATDIAVVQKVHEFCTRCIKWDYDIIDKTFGAYDLKTSDSEFFYDFIVRMYKELECSVNNIVFNFFDFDDIEKFLKYIVKL